MTIYEFYLKYIFTRKALFITTTSHQPLKTYLSASYLCVEHVAPKQGLAFEIPYDNSITSLPYYGIQISLLTDPIYITASELTGVISIPVPEPDELPF